MTEIERLEKLRSTIRADVIPTDTPPWKNAILRACEIVDGFIADAEREQAVCHATAEKVLDMAMATLAEIDRRLHSMKQPVVMPGSVEYEPVQPEPTDRGYPSEPSEPISDGRGMTQAGSPSVTSEPFISVTQPPLTSEDREAIENGLEELFISGLCPSERALARKAARMAYRHQKARAGAAEAEITKLREERDAAREALRRIAGLDKYSSDEVHDRAIAEAAMRLAREALVGTKGGE